MKKPQLQLPTISHTESTFQYADPYGVLKNISTDNKERLLVIDMRSPGDYKERRFKNTVNVYFPYEKDREQEKAFVKNVENEIGAYKQVVLLPYSSMSTTGEDAATLLIESGVENVAIMKAGWNELYSLPGMWIPEEKASELTLPELLDD